MKKLRDSFVVVLMLVTAIALPASAQMDTQMGDQMGEMKERGMSDMRRHKQMGYGMDHGMGQSQGYKKGRHGKHGMGRLFGPRWKETLTDEQKTQIDKMRLELKKAVSVLKAKLKVNKAELNNLVVQDNPDKKAVYRKIDDISGLKREIMRKKYDHKIEIRGILTPEQRVSFDMHLVSMAGHKRRH